MFALNLPPFQRRATASGLHLVFYAAILAATLVPWAYFAFHGFAGAPVDGWFLLRAIVGAAVVFLASWIITDRGRPSEFFLRLIVLLIVTPSMVLFTTTIRDWNFAPIVVAGYAVVAIVSRIHIPVRPLGWISTRLVIWIIAAVVVAYFAALILLGQLRFLNWDPMRVYDLRRVAAASLPTVFDYLLPWVSKVFITAGLAISLHQRHWLMFLFLSLAAVGIFAFGAHKEPVLYPVLIAATYAFAGRRNMLLPLMLLAAAGGMLIFTDSFQLYRVMVSKEGASFPGGSLLADYILRRGILVPSLLNAQYLEFFGGVGHPYWWADSRVTFGFLTSPYEVTAPFKIGIEFYDDPGMSANAGWIGMGYANGLILGVLVYSIAIGLVFSVIDALAERSAPLISAICVVPILAVIISSDLLTTLLTHGLILTLLLCVLLRTEAKPL